LRGGVFSAKENVLAMFKWLPYPFLRFTAVLILAILAASYSPWQMPFGVLLLSGGIFSLLTFAVPRRHRYRWHPLTGFAGLFWLFVTAYFYTQYRQDDRQPMHLSRLDETHSHYVATVTAPAEPRTNSYRSVVSLDYVVQQDSSRQISTLPAKANIIVYQPREDSLQLLAYGDQILVKGMPQQLKAPANPHEFDYRQFLAAQHIYHQHYLPAVQWVKKGEKVPNVIMQYAYLLRGRCQQMLQHIADPQARGIALALVLGIKNELDDDIRSAYAAAGAMHVLAVSGLHVGIIYLVIAFLLTPLEKSGQWGKILKALLCLLALWSYALLTGMSASVMRAATMFSFIIVAGAFRRQTNIYNTIAASAFFLLLYDPMLLLSVGFQLSYLAVLGIVYLQPMIYRWFTPNSKWLDWLWGLTAVSIAAQLATFPLGLYYFQQFPVYFWLSNILVIPAAYLILSLGLLCFFVGFAIPSLLYYPAWLLEKVIQFVNKGVMGIEQLPASVLKNIYFNPAETVALYLAILWLLMLLYYRNFRFVWMLSVCLLFIAASRSLHIYQMNRQHSITFYHVPKESRMDLNVGRAVIHLGDQNPKAMYHIAANHVYKAALTTFIADSADFKEVAMSDWHNLKLFVWQGKKIAMVREKFDRSLKLSDPLEVDLVVVCNNALDKLDELTPYLRYRHLIIDSSNAYYRAAKLAEEAAQQKIAYHCVPLQGAFDYQIE
jgi:competence protein ComEC